MPGTDVQADLGALKAFSMMEHCRAFIRQCQLAPTTLLTDLEFIKMFEKNNYRRKLLIHNLAKLNGRKVFWAAKRSSIGV